MSDGISRRGMLGGALALILTANSVRAESAAPATSLRPVGRADDLLRRNQATGEELIAKARLGANAEVSYAVANMQTGVLLEEHSPATGLPPASVAKALTASYALDVLGPEYRFETRILATGGIKDGIVQGDLILAGGGDPTLDTDGLAALAASMKAAGVTSVLGEFQVWGGALAFAPEIDTEQPPHVGYSPAVSGLNLNYNRVHFEWHRNGSGYVVNMDARTAAHRPSVQFARMDVVARSLPVYTYDDRDGRDDWTVARGALGDGGSRWLPVRKPELYAGEVFQTFARTQGISLNAPVPVTILPEGAEVVATQDSAPLRVILQDMLKWSTNLTAEAVGMAASKARLGEVPETLKASAAEMNAWAKERIGAVEVALVDHSGLGGDSRASALDMMLALKTVRPLLELKPLLKPFAMRDSQRRVVEDHPLKVHAKTGTLNFVSGLAGFVDLPDGTELVFAIFCADVARREALPMAQRERPEGGISWNVRAKTLQQALIERWGVMYAA